MKFKEGDYIKYVGTDGYIDFEERMKKIKSVKISKTLDTNDNFCYVLSFIYKEGVTPIFDESNKWYKYFIDNNFIKADRKLKLERVLR